MKNILTIAIQKSGRLKEASVDLLREAGLQIPNSGGQLKMPVSNFPTELYFLRDDDIPQYIADGVADIGIIGENVFLEKQKENTLIMRLGFSKCRLCIAIPKDQSYDNIQSLQGKQIATSYPVILKKFLDDNQVDAAIHEISGSVEIAPAIGLSEAICDIVSSGSTLLNNGLKEVETILCSEAVLIGRPELPDEKAAILEKLKFRIEAVQKAKAYRYILLNCPTESVDKIISVIPGMKSPTVMPLTRSGWSSLHSVVPEDDFWAKIDLLRAHGAEGILVIPIEKMIL